MSELKPCPFCKATLRVNPRNNSAGGHSDVCIIRYHVIDLDDEKQVAAWNTRAVPDVPELVRYDLDFHGSHGEDAYIGKVEDGEYVRHDQAAAMIAAKDIDTVSYKSTIEHLTQRAEAAEAKLALITDQKPSSEDFRAIGYSINAVEYPMPEDALWLFAAFNNVQPNQLSPAQHYHPNGSTQKAWERVAAAAKLLYAAPVASEVEPIKRFREALEASRQAFDDLFAHCLSNGVFNAWQKTWTAPASTRR